VIEDPRTSFQAGVDRQIVVLFEWEGPPGTHAGQASWKDPSGAVVLVAPFQQTSPSKRLSVYWTLALPDAPRLGLWAVEAIVDGLPAGVHTFQIQAGGGSPSGRRRPSAAELYDAAQATTLSVEALDATGNRLAVGSGFVAAEGLVLTAFQVIDGASRLRVSAYGKPPVETDEVAGWDRHQDWALLRTPRFPPPHLAIERERSWKVGDRCSFLDTGEDGVRVMTETVIVGAQQFPKAGPRLSINTLVGARAVGGPLLNEFGEAIAVLGGTLTPGLGLSAQRPVGYVPFFSVSNNGMAVPLADVPAAPATAPARLGDLAARGVFVPPVVGSVRVITGNFALKVETNSGVPMPIGEKSEFSRKEKEAVAFLTFEPHEKREGMTAFHVFDSDNRRIMQGRPAKMTLRPGRYSVTSWSFAIADLAPGVYRVDLVMADAPIWRSFFRIID
jgi:S1-C subfamily serine protease